VHIKFSDKEVYKMPDGAYTNSSIKLNMASLSYGPAFFDKEPQAQFTP
jgi:hypothetical protein